MNAFSRATRKESAHAPGEALDRALWVVQIAGAAMFFMAGLAKLTGGAPVVALFDAIGFGQWFRTFVGIAEGMGAAALMVPDLSGVGGLVLSVAMLGALLTHALLGGNPVGAIVLLVAMGFVAWGRRDRTLALLRPAP